MDVVAMITLLSGAGILVSLPFVMKGTDEKKPEEVTTDTTSASEGSTGSTSGGSTSGSTGETTSGSTGATSGGTTGATTGGTTGGTTGATTGGTTGATTDGTTGGTTGATTGGTAGATTGGTTGASSAASGAPVAYPLWDEVVRLFASLETKFVTDRANFGESDNDDFNDACDNLESDSAEFNRVNNDDTLEKEYTRMNDKSVDMHFLVSKIGKEYTQFLEAVATERNEPVPHNQAVLQMLKDKHDSLAAEDSLDKYLDRHKTDHDNKKQEFADCKADLVAML